MISSNEPSADNKNGTKKHKTRPQRITPRAMLEAKRISAPQLHPDGQHVAFVVTEADFEESRWVSHLWLTEWVPPPAANAPVVPPPATAEKPAESEAVKEPEADHSRQLTFSYEGEHQPRWSPDGRYLAFLSARPDPAEPPADEDDEEPKDQVWILPVDGGEARKITNAKEAVLDYTWTPEAKEIIYLTSEPRARPIETLRKEERDRRKVDPIVEHDDRKRRQFWRIDIEEKKPKLLFTGDYGVHECALSMDGQRLAYATNYTGFWNDYHKVDIFVRNLTDGTEIKLAERGGGKYNLYWSPDGSQLAFLSWLDPKLSYSKLTLFLADVPAPPIAGTAERAQQAAPLPSTTSLVRSSRKPSEAASPATDVPMPPTSSFVGVPVTAPQSQPLALSNASEKTAESSGFRLVTELDYDLTELHWSRHNGLFYAVAAVGTGSKIVRIQPDGRTKFVEGEPAERRDMEISGFNSAFVFIQETEKALPEVYLRDDFGKVHQLTRLNAEFTENYRVPRQEVVSWQSQDGLTIEGVLTYPLDYVEGTRYPLIVQVHGGPKGQAVNALLRGYSMPAVWSAEGYAVLQPNFRGSEGYGNAFAVANRRDLGGGDFQDILSGMDWCIEKGIADSERIGIMGGSYGGYMTNWAIGHTDRFAGAVSMFGIFHLQTDYSNSELSGWDNDYLGAYYWEDPEIYRKLSPGSYIENIKTPTLIIHGDDDNNTFISNSKELYQALRHRGVTVQFVHYPREGHGLSEPNHKLDEMRRSLAWMDRYVRHSGALPGLYRVGDRVLHADGLLELCVTHAEITLLAGQPKPEKTNGANGTKIASTSETALLEVQFTLHNPDTRTPAAPITLTLNDVRLENREPGESEPLMPVGVPLEVAGVKALLEGDNIRLVQHPDSDTGQLAFGFAVVFRVPKSGGDYLLRVADFPPVAVLWSGEEAEESEEKAEEEA